MAGDFQGLVLEKAELLSSRLKEALSSCQGYVKAQFGVDLGLKPELYPTWVILSTAAVGLLLLLCLSWAAVCGGLLGGKKRGSPVIRSSCESDKAISVKAVKQEEPKKRSKKKALEKKAQSNGQPVAVTQEEVKTTEAVSKPALQIKPEKVHEVQVPVQAPVQVKKSKKKNKTDVKPVQHVSTNEGKEPDDGAWETKVSHREKKQQRRKEKGSEDSGSPGGVEVSKTRVEATATTAPTSAKKSKGNHDAHQSGTTGKGDAASGVVSSSWRQETSVSGGGWTDMSLKMATAEKTNWSTIHTATHYSAPPKHQSWAQETPAAWSAIDGRMKTDRNPVTPMTFSMLGGNTTDLISNSMELQWTSQPDADDEWSGSNGMATVDPSSDWNAPVEHWGNYEEVVVTPVGLPKEPPVPNKTSEDEKDIDESSSGAAKSKKKKKKKKKLEEGVEPEAKVSTVPKEVSVQASKKQSPSMSFSQKKYEQSLEPSKPSQKKKAQRET
ncbi:uncharacterized protein V6R79_020353 [Siganus canaliculatus]